jgi:hypothetical protein
MQANGGLSLLNDKNVSKILSVVVFSNDLSKVTTNPWKNRFFDRNLSPLFV